MVECFLDKNNTFADFLDKNNNNQSYLASDLNINLFHV